MLSRRTTVVLTALLVALVAGLGTAIAKSRRPDPAKHFTSQDIRLHIPHPKNMKGWKQKTTYEGEDEKNLQFMIVMKKPDSSDPFDVQISAEGWAQNMNLTFKNEDGTETTVSTGSVGRIAEIMAERIEKTFKEIKEKKPLRKTRISRTIKKGYYFEITGRAQIPLHRRLYCFGVNGKTYVMHVVLTTTAARDEALVKTVDKMIKSMIAWKP
jgi:hypothetical protein